MPRMPKSFGKDGKMPKAKKGTLPRLLKLLFKDNKGTIIFLGFVFLLSVFAGNISSIFIRGITDDVVTKGINTVIDLRNSGYQGDVGAVAFNTIKDSLFTYLIIMASIYGTGIICNFITNRTMGIMTHKFMNKIRKMMFNHMETLPIKYFDTHKHGDIMSMYTNDIDTLQQLISQSIPSIVQTVFVLAILISLMFSFSFWLALFVIAMSVVMVMVSKGVGGNSAKYFVKRQRSMGLTEGFIEEMIHGQKVVKVFNHEEKAKAEFEKFNEQLRLDDHKAHVYSNILGPIMNNIGNLLYVSLIVLGAVLSILKVPNLNLVNLFNYIFNKGALTEDSFVLTIGTVISFLGMSKAFTNNCNQAAQQITFIAMGMAGASRCFELIDEQSEADNGYVTLVNAYKDENGNICETSENTRFYAWKHPHGDGTLTYTELKGDIRLFDVDFGYDKGKIVLHNIDIYAEPGQKIAFVGATGAGKTTITNLINRFYDIEDGKVRYDGININKIKKADLRRSLGIVFQETNLFTGTVKDNIKYGKLDATDEEVINAAKIANAYDFITRLPQGFDTELKGDGSNLSQGQRQLLSIARAAIKDAPVMILDEATSSIDTRTELLVQRGTDKLMEGRTVFVIAHRLSTVQNSDAIMVLDHGRIIERGPHDALIKQKGTYYQLYTGAFELE